MNAQTLSTVSRGTRIRRDPDAWLAIEELTVRHPEWQVFWHLFPKYLQTFRMDHVREADYLEALFLLARYPLAPRDPRQRPTSELSDIDFALCLKTNMPDWLEYKPEAERLIPEFRRGDVDELDYTLSLLILAKHASFSRAPKPRQEVQ